METLTATVPIVWTCPEMSKSSPPAKLLFFVPCNIWRQHWVVAIRGYNSSRSQTMSEFLFIVVAGAGAFFVFVIYPKIEAVIDDFCRRHL